MPLIWILKSICVLREGGNSRFLQEKIADACFSVKELGLQSASDVTVCVPEMQMFPNDPMIVIVDLLFDKPERTHDVRRRLAEAIGAAIERVHKERHIDQIIEVAIRRFNPKTEGFWTNAR